MLGTEHWHSRDSHTCHHPWYMKEFVSGPSNSHRKFFFGVLHSRSKLFYSTSSCISRMKTSLYLGSHPFCLTTSFLFGLHELKMYVCLSFLFDQTFCYRFHIEMVSILELKHSVFCDVVSYVICSNTFR